MEQRRILIQLLDTISRKMIEVEPELTELDSKIGDGDCGIGIKTGFSEVLEKIPQWQEDSISDILKKTGMTLVSSIGGTSGAILGTGFMRMAMQAKDKIYLTMKDCADLLCAALKGMSERGENTQIGDKTMIDALTPAVEVFRRAAKTQLNLKQGLREAAVAAKKGSDSTIDMIAKKGRASYLGERSRGNRDAGSMAIYYMFEAARDFFGA